MENRVKMSYICLIKVTEKVREIQKLMEEKFL